MSKNFNIEEHVVPEGIPPELWEEALANKRKSKIKNKIRDKIEELMKSMTEGELDSLWEMVEKIKLK